MKKFIETLVNIYKIEELRNRIGLTLSILLIYRLGAQIVLPGIDSVQLASLASRTDGGGLLGILNAFTGGAFANASIFALGNYALYICFYCCSVNGNCYSLFAETSKRRRKWS